MVINVEPLRKILNLERQKEYNDLAVMGGLDRFLRNWSGQATASISNPGLMKRFRELSLHNTTYAAMDKGQRENWVNFERNFLQNRKHGRLGGQLRIRIRYRRIIGPWMDYLLVSKQELEQIVIGTGWAVWQYIDISSAAYFLILEKD